MKNLIKLIKNNSITAFSIAFISITLVAYLIKNKPIELECHYVAKDKMGIYRQDLFPFSIVKINKYSKTLHFYFLRPDRITGNGGVSWGAVAYSDKGNSYETDSFYQPKLTKEQSEVYDDKREYLYPDYKSELLRIWLDRSTLKLQIVPANLRSKSKFSKLYNCYKQREIKKKSYKKQKLKI